METKKATVYYNSGLITVQQIIRNRKARNILKENGYTQLKEIDVSNDFKLISELKEKFKLLKYPLIILYEENDKKTEIGSLSNLEFYFKSKGSKNESNVQKQQKQTTEPKKDSNDEKTIEIKQVIKEKAPDLPVISSVMQQVENVYKATSYIIGYLPSVFFTSKKKEQIDNSVPNVYIPVNRVNWYGRVQQRTLKFKNDCIERLDANQSVRFTYKFTDLKKITVTDANSFRLVYGNNCTDFYQASVVPKIIQLFKERVTPHNHLFQIENIFQKHIAENDGNSNTNNNGNSSNTEHKTQETDKQQHDQQSNDNGDEQQHEDQDNDDNNEQQEQDKNDNDNKEDKVKQNTQNNDKNQEKNAQPTVHKQQNDRQVVGDVSFVFVNSSKSNNK